MPRLLRDVLCVIETFHKYAREDGEVATLTSSDLKQLVQDEFGDVLQPHVIHAVESNLNRLDIDSDGIIGFDKFVLAIFHLLDLCYLDIQSLLNSEPGRVSEPEEKPDDMGLQATGTTGQRTEGTPPTQDNIPSGNVSSAQLNSEERGCNRVDPQQDTKTHKLPGETSGHSDPENQTLEGGEQSQEVTQDVSATGTKGAQIETNKQKAGSEQIGSPTKGEGQDEEIPREGDEPAWERSAAETRDQLGEQEGNLGAQTSPSEETIQRPHDEQQVAAERGVQELSNTREQPLQGKDKPSSARADLAAQAAAWKPLQTQKSNGPEDDSRTDKTREPGKDADRTAPETENPADPEEDGRTSDIPESPTEEKEHETKDLSMQGDSRNVSETPDVRTERKDGRSLEAHGTKGQEESERKTQPPALEDKTQGGKCQELQEPHKGRDAEEAPKTQEVSPEGGAENHAEAKGAVAEGDKAGDAEEGAAEAPGGSSGAPAAEGTAGARGTMWPTAPQEDQSGGGNQRVTKTHDQPLKEGDHHQEGASEPTVTQSDKVSPEPRHSLTPEDGDCSSETSDLPVHGDSQRQGDPLGESVQGSHRETPDTQKQVALGEGNRTQKAVAPTVAGGEDKPLTEEQEQLDGEEHRSWVSETRGPSPAVEPAGHPEAQESTVGGEDRKSQETEIPGALSANVSDQLYRMQLLTKEVSKEELKVQHPGTDEEDGAPEPQEALVKSLDEDRPASPKTLLETEETATLQEEDKSPPELAGGDDPPNPAKKGSDSSVPQSALEETTQRDQEPCCAKRGTVLSSLLYEYLQEMLLEQTGRTAGQCQTQGQTASASSPELRKDQLTTDISDCSVFSDDS